MLYLIYGTDTDKAREKARALFDALKAKKSDASAGSFTAENISNDKIEELTQSQGLFENKQIIFMDRVLENKDVREMILDKADAIAESPNIFIFLEGKLAGEALKKLKKKAEKATEYSSDGETGKESSGFFPMADALGSRDRKKLWILFREAMDKDAVPEEIHGILFWQAKNLALAEKCDSASEAGMSSFVYGKAKRNLRNWKDGEVQKMLSKLAHMYHRAHRGQADFGLELEKFTLDL